MAGNDSKKRRLENVIAALKNDKVAIAALVFLVIVIVLSLAAPILPLEPNGSHAGSAFMGASFWNG